MTATRKQRRPPARRPSKQPVRHRRTVRKKVDWQDRLMQLLIGLLLIVNLVLIFFIVRHCSKRPAVVTEKQPVVEEARPLQIEVLNGCGVSGIAAQFTDYLRAKGFDVVKTDNYESFNIRRTVVIDRRGVLRNGVRVARALGLGEERVLQEANEAYLLDASLILGSDYRQLECWQEIEN